MDEINDPTGGTPEPVDHQVRVIVTNPGDGLGSVAVTFSAGTVTNNCPAVLAPGATCTVDANHTAEISSVSIAVQPGDFSIFEGFGRACSGTQSECTIPTVETTVTLHVDVVFNLRVARIDFTPDPLTVASGAQASVQAAASADAQGTVPVEAAVFTWETSNAGVATVQGGAAGAATVSGVASGAAWIRATARNTKDSVRVVVGG
jgi:hypothetical protein